MGDFEQTRHDTKRRKMKTKGRRESMVGIDDGMWIRRVFVCSALRIKTKNWWCRLPVVGRGGVKMVEQGPRAGRNQGRQTQQKKASCKQNRWAREMYKGVNEEETIQKSSNNSCSATSMAWQITLRKDKENESPPCSPLKIIHCAPLCSIVPTQ